MKTLLSLIALIQFGICCTVFSQTGNNSLSFDGTDDYVSIPHNDIFNVSKVTIEMRMLWQNTTVPADVDFLIGKKYEELEIHTGGDARNHALRFIPTSLVYLDTENDVFQSGVWYHIAFVYDPSISLAKCYIDGAECSLTNRGTNPITTSIMHSNTPLKIGVRADKTYENILSYYFQGKIDEVRIWNVVRTAEEINLNKNKELTGSESGLVAYYKMSDGSGETLTDNSGNGNTGTLMNGTQWVTEELMPVELISFSVSSSGNATELRWNTATEVNNYGFDIERAFADNPGRWTKIGFVSGAGNSNSSNNYKYSDQNVKPAKYLYRLKQIDTDGGYCYSSVVEVVVNQMPEEFELSGNFPNPFNPSTIISYKLPAASNVMLVVYDMLGREIEKLVNEKQEAGVYNVSFNASKFANGIYIARLSADKYSKSIKMSLVK